MARNGIDLTGQRFGMLKVLEKAESSPKGGRRWLCQCDCGGKKVVLSSNLRRGTTKSCGCLTSSDLTNSKVGRLTVIEKLNEQDASRCWLWRCQCECGNEIKVRSSTLRKNEIESCGCKRIEDISSHGLSHTRIYQIWLDMHRRCYNPDRGDYKYYGGKGVRVEPSWHDVHVFLEDMGHPPSDEHTLDRKDTNGNYCKDNCRWVTWDVQANNKTDNVFLEYDDKKQTIAQWARELDVNPHSLRNRIFLYGWSVEDALTKPYR